MARGMGEVGVLTDSDVVKYVRSGKLTQKGSDIIKKWMTGVPSNATMAEIDEILFMLKNVVKEKQDDIRNDYLDRYSAIEGIKQEDLAKGLGMSYKIKNKTESKQVQPEKIVIDGIEYDVKGEIK